jgi:hypothetical protein
VARDAPNSCIARENLRRLKGSIAECDFGVEIVDVMENPQAALEHGVFVTPALQNSKRLFPGPLPARVPLRNTPVYVGTQ